jgi:hypothetical protein
LNQGGDHWRSAAALLALLFGCHADDDGSRRGAGDASELDAEARVSGCSVEVCAPYQCDERFDRCRLTCAESAHCMPGFTCDAGVCIGGACTEESARAICGPYACVRGECAVSCATTGCAAGFYCRGDSMRCVPSCREREDPVCDGFVCDLTVGECESVCLAGAVECAAGFACGADGLCRPGDR